MTRISEKVKDLIQVCSYRSLLDFSADPGVTLEGYHFTDITSQLMAAWIDSLVDLQSRKINAKALAGYRGVGKSHFLAVFGALISNPEFRSMIQDGHVAASANHLMRRSYPVAFVKRGTKELLEDEVREAIALTMGCSGSDLPEGLSDLMAHAEQFSGDVPLVILIDTDLERERRVARDDGAYLGLIAEAIKDRNIFIGVALDDDITGADGINSAIANTYTIDYLDQEHLYKIVDTHIFRKHRQSQSLIKDIYKQFRETLPSFKWSEPRFTSLYPLHPSILEIAPFVRLYAPEFALLGFASEAGARIMGRPANSLIALDEVFDKVEDTLRKAPDLEGSFETYDAISKEVVSSIPVMQRLQAKLILKALFVLSLDGDGTTANEIAAAMLIFDESDPNKSEQTVLEILETFISFLPDSLHRKEENGEVRFSFRVTGKDDLITALAVNFEEVSEDVIPVILNRIAKDRFSDWNLNLAETDEFQQWTDCQLSWRGGVRKGRIHWQWGADTGENVSNVEGIDIELFVTAPGGDDTAESLKTNSFQWCPAELSQEEIDTVRRYHLLLHDDDIKENYHEQVRAAGHTHAINVAKIWERVFLTDGKIVAADSSFIFWDDLDGNTTVGEVVSKTIAPYFEEKYPRHPVFESQLDLKHVSLLVNDLFSGARVNNAEVQELARQFAEPLGLVELNDENYVLAKEEDLSDQPFISHLLDILESSEDDTVSLTDVYSAFKQPPFGLVREAQQLLMAALVAHRKVEFITSKGDRIGRRSLDLKIIWDDIAGISKPADLLYPTARLNEWARLIAGLDAAVSIEKPADLELIEQGIGEWSDRWNEGDTVRRFRDLPDEALNTSIWQIVVNVERGLGTVAEAVAAFREKSLSIEELFERIADGFSDSDEEYESRMTDFVSLKSFVDGVGKREMVWGYLATCEITRSDPVEVLRDELYRQIDAAAAEPTETANKNLENTWSEFNAAFSEHYVAQHDSVMKSHTIQEEFQEIKKSDDWWKFERLSALPVFQKRFWKESKTVFKLLNELDCSFDIRKQLDTNPFCSCSFTLAKIVEWQELPDRLKGLISRGLTSYQNTLRMMKSDLDVRLKELSETNTDPELVKCAVSMIESLDAGEDIDFGDSNNLGILETVFHTGDSSQMISAAMPDKSGIQSADTLRAGLNEWIDELPADPVLIKIDI